jgi:hypothetical protein
LPKGLTGVKASDNTPNTWPEYSPGHDAGRALIVRLTLPDDVTDIEDFTGVGYAFYQFTNLKSVSAGTNFTGAIGYFAFHDCSSLTTADFPAVSSIGIEAFENCISLTSFFIPATASIGVYHPFPGCIALTSITVAVDNPNYKSDVTNKMLLNKAGDKLIAYPSANGTITLSGITSIDPLAFQDCIYLTSVSMPQLTATNN